MDMRGALASLILLAGVAGFASAEEAAGTPKDGGEVRVDATLDSLFAALGSSGPGEAPTIQAKIYEIWNDPGSDSMRLIFERAKSAMAERRLAVAIEHLDDLVLLAPDFAEGWNARATAHYLAGEYARSLDDIDATLRLEPRHFGALSGQGMVFLATGKPRRALDSFRQALRLHPHMPGPQALVRELTERFEQSI